MLPAIIVVLAVVGWLLPSFLVAWAAGQRGRNETNWFYLSLCCSPLAALLTLLAVPELRETGKQEAAPRESLSQRFDLDAWDLRGANLTNARELTRDQVLSARDWRGAQLPPNLKDLELPWSANEKDMDRLGRTWRPEKKPE